MTEMKGRKKKGTKNQKKENQTRKKNGKKRTETGEKYDINQTNLVQVGKTKPNLTETSNIPERHNISEQNTTVKKETAWLSTTSNNKA